MQPRAFGGFFSEHVLVEDLHVHLATAGVNNSYTWKIKFEVKETRVGAHGNRMGGTEEDVIGNGLSASNCFLSSTFMPLMCAERSQGPPYAGGATQTWPDS